MENKSIWNIGCGIVVAIVLAIILLTTNDRGTLASVGIGAIILVSLLAAFAMQFNSEDSNTTRKGCTIIAAVTIVLIILTAAVPEVTIVLGILCIISICCYLGYKIYKDLS